MIHTLTIASTWDGQAIAPEQQSHTTLQATNKQTWIFSIDAPFYNDPKPPKPIGHTDGLWNYEVVELFILGQADESGAHPYVEFEFSPHGHHLVLELHGTRQIIGVHKEVDYQSRIKENRWTGQVEFPTSWLPRGELCCNIYAIHGVKEERCYQAMTSVPGKAPDFHRLSYFERSPLQL